MWNIVAAATVRVDDGRMSVVDMPDRQAWSSTLTPTLSLGADGQVSWAVDVDDETSDTQRRTSPSGDVIVLRHVWSGDRTVLRRLVVEASWHEGPLAFVEARRPRGGWRGDELGRLLLAVLSCGLVVR